MKHLGDITKIDGANAPVVDVFIGGSPCQDLSLAGKRAGLDGERSGLFMEQIRIIKEMRDEDKRNGKTGVDVRPRYMVWENVPGSFSSNKGEDFRIVLEETAKVADENAVIPQPTNGKWTTCGCIVGDGWSIAWRILDAQFWGVPQRRRRIALVADFAGQSAGEILFVRKSVSGHSEQGESKGKETSSNVARSVGADDRERVSYTLKIRSGCEGGGKGALIQTEKSATLSTLQDQTLFQPVCITCDEKMGNTYCWEEQANTLAARDYKQPQAVCYAAKAYGFDPQASRDVGQYFHEEKANTIHNGTCYGYKNGVCIKAVDCRNGTESDINATLQSNMAHSLNGNNVVRVKYIVRRLTPLECERLQGYPDGWTDIGEWVDSNGKKHKTSDASRYKALGNSIALPPWKWVLKRICACYERDATMASLFDGIGGFPYLWEQLNGKGTCLWASEIEEFPIAVTKMRIGGN